MYNDGNYELNIVLTDYGRVHWYKLQGDFRVQLKKLTTTRTMQYKCIRLLYFCKNSLLRWMWLSDGLLAHFRFRVVLKVFIVQYLRTTELLSNQKSIYSKRIALQKLHHTGAKFPWLIRLPVPEWA